MSEGKRVARFSVRIEPSGWTFEVGPDQPILAAARASGIDLPASCRNGTCRTCLCKLAGGTIRHNIEWPGLSAEEKREGYVLPCVALAQSDLVLIVPAARRLPG
ncbi:2Fe-2S iron-sulfur cluster-binding protein [Noviherbaspirillum saxi]|uniref:(2Fe-2S)-binding protein n=1 Tax=Noviherbaspirillum saxi TaxID=2320863 RepID=A0A3A3FY14_9BURK|nr:2Fe-2S iron-sulfur cluster-binding protein [Noviherbaspirillum saxi]RJF99091.1 (2Fe-2S)-binding protein [Noviherbaspirillum saxi]